ncbi:ISL3 family transposase [Nodosilinea sp. LEGE 07298]|uniref:ISL3 family transposase n=1 Tax=Nodosilinea sp. LEGE 07298 TaxID=2777970 RepID=UPI0018818B1B|nr:ISL3 family transposase [Nodosilinea sp. LEGE 07298]MBE9108119.1 ISL3 family transposase [Nodosilinea sp. LEGE 07298]
MDLISHLLPSQTELSLQHWDLDTATQQVTVYLASTQTVAQCPLCHRPSHRIHSHYDRTLKDLPVVQFSLTIVLTVCKVFCLNDTCPRRIFTERLPGIVAPWARRTIRYVNHLKAIALALGGAAGARLSEQVGYRHSRNSMLRVIASLPLPQLMTPKILGVDDFALRKGHNYGTILVDLEQHQPIALLPDRTAETLETWLKEHPGVEVLSRDRSKTYKRGMSQGAPEAIQVADRFHLLHNLEETLETAFKGHYSVLKQVEKDQRQADGLEVPHSSDLPEDPQSPKALNRAHRLETYEQTHALRQQGYAIKDIAHHLGLGKRTVYKYLAASTFPERQPTIRQQGSGMDAYKPYIQDQWNRGQQQTKALFHLIQQQGYPGSYSTLARYTHQLRQLPASGLPSPDSLNDLSGRGPAPPLSTSPQKPLSARRAAWLILQRPETRTAEDDSLLEQLAQQPELSGAISLAQGFIDLVRQRLPSQLDDWLQAAKTSSIKAFQSFAKGLEEDYDAVKAGMTLEVSNGPVEGQNNRLKMLKRQMFGRANLELLEKRFILTS